MIEVEVENRSGVAADEAGLGVVAQDLVAAPNVILTPHVAGITAESQLRINEILVANIELVLSGKSATHAVGAVK